MSNARKSSPRARSEGQLAGGQFGLLALAYRPDTRAMPNSELCAIPFRSWRKGRVCRPVVSLPWTSWGLVPQPFPRLTVS